LPLGYISPSQRRIKGIKMSKADFIEVVAKKGNLSKADAKRTVEIVFEAIETGLKTVKNGGKYQIGTFGTFTVSKRAARMGRNPRTGEAIKIKASRGLRFKPASQLKDAAGC
jgi:DNA-binding protein HU-beta